MKKRLFTLLLAILLLPLFSVNATEYKMVNGYTPNQVKEAFASYGYTPDSKDISWWGENYYNQWGNLYDNLQRRFDRQINSISQGFGASSVLPIAGATYTLAGSGVSGSATSITLQSLTLPQTGQLITDSDLSDTFYITLEPANTKRQEIASCTTVTQNAGGTATLSGCSRGLSPLTPYTASTTLQFAHAGGSRVIFSDPPQLFNQFSAKANNETINGTWVFESYPVASSTIGNATTTYQFISLGQAQALANQGAATSTPSIAGISREATAIQTASSTDLGVNDPLHIPTNYTTSTPTYSCDASGTTGALCIPVAENDGKLNQGWLDLTEDYTFTGNMNLASTTFNASTTWDILPEYTSDPIGDNEAVRKSYVDNATAVSSYYGYTAQQSVSMTNSGTTYTISTTTLPIAATNDSFVIRGHINTSSSAGSEVMRVQLDGTDIFTVTQSSGYSSLQFEIVIVVRDATNSQMAIYNVWEESGSFVNTIKHQARTQSLTKNMTSALDLTLKAGNSAQNGNTGTSEYLIVEHKSLSS